MQGRQSLKDAPKDVVVLHLCFVDVVVVAVVLHLG